MSHGQDDEMLAALEDAQLALTEIANTSVGNWPENTPVDKYKVIMAHMADQAREASRKLTKEIIRFKS